MGTSARHVAISAAFGHTRRATPAYGYVQTMVCLPEIHQDAHQTIKEGYHVLRCTDKFWQVCPHT